MYSLFHPLSSLSSITQQQLKTRPIRLWLLLFYMLLFYFLGTVSLDLQLQWSPFPVTFDLMSVESFKLVMSFDYKILIPTWTFFISTIFPDFLTIFWGGGRIWDSENINFLRNVKLKFQRYFTVFLAVQLHHMIKYFSKKK